eukprot:1340289-Amphidinium_carterae.3
MSTPVVQEWQLWEGRTCSEKGNAFLSVYVLHVGLKSITFQCASNFAPPLTTVHGSGIADWVIKAANIDLPGLLGFRQRVNRVYVAQN